MKHITQGRDSGQSSSWAGLERQKCRNIQDPVRLKHGVSTLCRVLQHV